MAGGIGGGFERGAQALTQGIMGGLSLKMQQDRYDKYDARYKDAAAREEEHFNRKMAIERGKARMPPSYEEAMKKELDDPQAQADEALQGQVMQHQEGFHPQPEASIPSAAHIAQPTQVGRLQFPGSQMRMRPMPPAAAPLPSAPPTMAPSPAAALARPDMSSDAPPTDPSRSLFGGGRPSVRRQPMMPRFARPRAR